MKVLFAATVFALSLSASAIEFKTGSIELPISVESTIHAAVEDHCSRDVSAIQSFNLVSSHIELVRIDQGYVENHYSLKFKVVYKDSKGPFTDTYDVNVVDQLQDRSGSLQTYVVDYRTNICQ